MSNDQLRDYILDQLEQITGRRLNLSPETLQRLSDEAPAAYRALMGAEIPDGFDSATEHIAQLQR